MDPTVTPIQLPVRKTHLALKDRLKDELDRLEGIGVISPIEEPTDWVFCVVITPKPTVKLRVCLDPKPLNKALKRSRTPGRLCKPSIVQSGKTTVLPITSCWRSCGV